VSVNRPSATQNVMVALLLRLADGGVGVGEAGISIEEGGGDVSARLCGRAVVGTKLTGAGMVAATLRDGSVVGAGLSGVGVVAATLRDGSVVGAGLSGVGMVVATLRDDVKKESLQFNSSSRKLTVVACSVVESFCCSVAKLPDSLVRLPNPLKKAADPELKVSVMRTTMASVMMRCE
jgi:hypothetical protein